MDLKRLKAELYKKQRHADTWGDMIGLNRINNLIYKINCRLRKQREQEIAKRREERFAEIVEKSCMKTEREL